MSHDIQPLGEAEGSMSVSEIEAPKSPESDAESEAPKSLMVDREPV